MPIAFICRIRRSSPLRSVGDSLLLNDGRLRVEAIEVDRRTASVTKVIFGGMLSDRKGLNLPDTVVPDSGAHRQRTAPISISPANLGVDWIALSFVQRPDDVAEARKLIAGRAGVMAKIEKPSALHDTWRNPRDFRLRSWWRAAISASNCRSKPCRRARSRSPARRARPAGRSSSPPRCSNR